MTDEQHRFGVAQRAKLLSKGKNPHLLVMSATPIPRTLGLIIFGDLDISIIDELPPSRKPVKTVLFNTSQRQRVFGFIKKEIAAGRQAYIVCPLVEEGELDDVVSAEEYAAELMLKQFSDIPVGVVHGQMKSDEKEAVMSKFASGELKLLGYGYRKRRALRTFPASPAQGTCRKGKHTVLLCADKRPP